MVLDVDDVDRPGAGLERDVPLEIALVRPVRERGAVAVEPGVAVDLGAVPLVGSARAEDRVDVDDRGVGGGVARARPCRPSLRVRRCHPCPPWGRVLRRCRCCRWSLLRRCPPCRPSLPGHRCRPSGRRSVGSVAAVGACCARVAGVALLALWADRTLRADRTSDTVRTVGPVRPGCAVSTGRTGRTDETLNTLESLRTHRASRADHSLDALRASGTDGTCCSGVALVALRAGLTLRCAGLPCAPLLRLLRCAGRPGVQRSRCRPWRPVRPCGAGRSVDAVVPSVPSCAVDAVMTRRAGVALGAGRTGVALRAGATRRAVRACRTGRSCRPGRTGRSRRNDRRRESLARVQGEQLPRARRARRAQSVDAIGVTGALGEVDERPCDRRPSSHQNTDHPRDDDRLEVHTNTCAHLLLPLLAWPQQALGDQLTPRST